MIRIPAGQVLTRLGVESVGELKLQKLLNRVPYIGPSGPWVAGGAVRRTFTGEPLDSDFDFFFKNQEQLNAFKQGLESVGAKLVSFNDMNETWIIPDEFDSNEYEGINKRYTYIQSAKIQLIKFKFFDTLEEVLDAFDYTIAQFGFDGIDFVMSEFSLWDVARKRLVPHKITYGTSSVRRMLKYASQGYTVCQGCIGTVLEQIAEDPTRIEKEVVYID